MNLMPFRFDGDAIATNVLDARGAERTARLSSGAVSILERKSCACQEQELED